MIGIRAQVVLLALIGLSACAPRQAAVIEERTVLTERQQDEKIGGQFIRIVQPGDTLYSIAFVTGLDVNRIAAWNGITDTSRLRAGQRIRLTKPIGFIYRQKKTKPVESQLVKRAVAKNGSSKNKRAASSKVNASKKGDVSAKSASVRSASSKRASSNNKKAKQHLPVPSTSKPRSVPVDWQWPLRGTLVNRFKPSKGYKGINIQGQRGQGVRATASGEVVYAGNSLKGYGHLIIVKHSDVYWSAYANNEKITTAEGQKVVQGQVIAKLGSNSRGKAVAQFQIRKNGTPVDPMLYLK